MKKYITTVEIRGFYEKIIEAENEEEAAEYAEEDASYEISFSDCDVTTKVEEVKE